MDIAPKLHTNGWDIHKDDQYCNVIIGRKTDAAAEGFKGWDYAKVDGHWFEIYSKFECGIRSKITSCEAVGKAPLCQVRKRCGSFSKVAFYSVWAIPQYPSSAGAYKKYDTAPQAFVDKALSKNIGQMAEVFENFCKRRCAWY